MKATGVTIAEEVNQLVWARGIKNPPRRIKLEMERDEDGVVSIKLPAEAEKV